MTRTVEHAYVERVMAVHDVINACRAIMDTQIVDCVIVVQLEVHRQFVMRLGNARVCPTFREGRVNSAEPVFISTLTALPVNVILMDQWECLAMTKESVNVNLISMGKDVRSVERASIFSHSVKNVTAIPRV